MSIFRKSSIFGGNHALDFVPHSFIASNESGLAMHSK